MLSLSEMKKGHWMYLGGDVFEALSEGGERDETRRSVCLMLCPSYCRCRVRREWVGRALLGAPA